MILFTISPAQSAIPYKYNLTIISSDTKLKSLIETYVTDYSKKNSKIELASDERLADRVAVGLFIIAERHKSSRINKESIAFSVAHTTKADIFGLVSEVFSNQSNSNNQVKNHTYNLIVAQGGILKHLNIAVIDKQDEMTQVLDTFLADFSKRISNYYD